MKASCGPTEVKVASPRADAEKGGIMRRPFLPGFPSTSRIRRWRLLLTAVPAFVLGCANEPVGPQSEAAAPLFDEKDKGKGGKDGTVFVFAGQSCPAGEFVTGFDDSGQIICATPGGEPPQEPNTPPTVESVTLDPSPAFTTSELVCHAVVNDPDAGDVVTTTFSWFDNGTLVESGESNRLNLDSPAYAGIKKSDVVRCEVTANDGTDNSIPVSAETTIANSPPIIGNVFIDPVQPVWPEEMFCDALSVDDYDGDSLIVRYTWYSNGTKVFDGQYLRGTDSSPGNTYTCEVIADDGTDFSDPVSVSVFLQ
jgi:hypothetical protein